ncbi:MAG: DUF1080 domain-containing protein [Planctomycetes bacterium]|nr:DUF1080 domain-containing protein [Planctomycetota bacterium]
MRCEDVAELLSGRTLAELSCVENAAVSAHLAACPACREKWALDGQSQELHEAIQALRVREGAEHSLLAKLDAEEGPAQPGPAPLPPEMPKEIGGFEILELLGRGGMGSVYRARQVSLGRLVALKVIAARLAADERFVTRFEREARAAAAVQHPNIVAVYSVGEDNGQHYIAMELVAGESLDALAKRGGPLPQDRALGLMKQATAALAAAHEADIVHRDIKPSNILLGADGSVKVADFGLAKRIHIDVKVTATGTTVGTPLYMAPEAAGAKPFDARADLYSLGATFYHVLAGRPPFEGKTPVEVIVKHATEEPQPLAAAAPHLDPRLCQIIDRLLRKDPAERYPSARALLDALDALGPLQTPAQAARAEGEAMIRDASTVTLGMGRRLEREAAVQARLRDERPPRTRRAIVAAAVIAAAVLAGIVVATRRPKESATPPLRADEVRVAKPPDKIKEPPVVVDDPTAKRRRELETAAENAWTKIVEASKGDLAPAQAKALAASLDEFEKKHQGTGAYQAAQGQIPALRERVRIELMPPAWVTLFDGKSLKGWKVVGPALEPAAVKEGQLVLGQEGTSGGVVRQGEFPRLNYEVSLEAMKIAGNVDFCMIVFPIGDQEAVWKFGGGATGNHVALHWVNGGVIPGDEAARVTDITAGRWYKLRIRVTDERVEGWMDEEKKFDLARGATKFTLEDMYAGMRPFGIGTWYTQGAVRNLRLRRLAGGAAEWQALFDGKTLTGWRVLKEFAGAGPRGGARVEEGRVVLPPGKPFTAIAWAGEFPVNDYEVRFQAMRAAGESEFGSVVFPIGWASCQLVLGGWGGTVVGVNIVDGRRPHEDATAKRFVFTPGRWYSFRLRVTTVKVEAWIGEEKVVDLTRAGRKLLCENEAVPMRPLAFYSQETTGAVREIQVRELTPGVLKGLTVEDEPKALTTVSFTAPFDVQGLRPICEGDGLFVEGDRDGKAVLHQQSGRPGHDYLYFWAAEPFAEQFRTETNKTAFLTITLLDTAPGLVGVDYDSHAQLPNTDGGRWTRTGRQRLGGTGQWVELRFPLPRARFGHRQNYGADFRISHDADLLIHRVTVTSKEEHAEEERAKGVK